MKLIKSEIEVSLEKNIPSEEILNLAMDSIETMVEEVLALAKSEIERRGAEMGWGFTVKTYL